MGQYQPNSQLKPSPSLATHATPHKNSALAISVRYRAPFPFFYRKRYRAPQLKCIQEPSPSLTQLSFPHVPASQSSKSTPPQVISKLLWPSASASQDHRGSCCMAFCPIELLLSSPPPSIPSLSPPSPPCFGYGSGTHRISAASSSRQCHKNHTCN